MAKQQSIGEHGLRIINFVAENVKRIKAVDITPTSDVVTLTGKNKQGKTSILDSIWWAIEGTSHIQAQPIRKGETKAHVRLELGNEEVELIVERRFTATGSVLAVETPDGDRKKSPQAILDTLVGGLAFDPLAFARMDPKKQFEELRRIAKLEVDIDKLDGQNAGDFAKRTEVNRDARAKRATAEAIVVASGLPDAPLDESALLDRITAAGEQNTMLERRKAGREQAQREANEKLEYAKRARQRAAELRASADEVDKEADAMFAASASLQQKIDEAEALPAPADVAPIRVELEHAKQVNAKLAARDRRRQLDQEAEALEQQAAKLTEQIEARKRAKADAIAAAEMPIAGLGFGDGIVTLNEIPFEQASDAEQLGASMAIAMAANPKLRVIRIRDGSLLDPEAMAAVTEMARANKFQVWIEVVETSGKVGVYIEDGAVVAVDGVPVADVVAA